MITAQMVKELRERTSAGMMDCKEHWRLLMVIWKSIDELRTKGLAKAAKEREK